MGELIRMVSPNGNRIDYSVYIERYLLNKINSENTRRNYRSDLKDYFKLVKGKEISEIEKSDLVINISSLEYFIRQLKLKKGSSGKTIERKLTAVKGFFKYLSARSGTEGFEPIPQIDTSFFNEVSQPPTESKGYATLDFEEAKKIAAYLFETEREKKLLKKHLINFGLDTGLRLAEILKIRCSDFQDRSEDEYYFKVKGKFGKWNERWVKKYFIDDIMEDLGLNIYSNERLFNISTKTVEEMMQRLKENPKYRNMDIVFHSIRGAAITEFYYLTRDPIRTMEYANHKSFDTTRKYIRIRKEKFTGTLTFDKEQELGTIINSKPEVLVNAISKCSPYIQGEIVKEMKKIDAGV